MRSTVNNGFTYNTLIENMDTRHQICQPSTFLKSSCLTLIQQIVFFKMLRDLKNCRIFFFYFSFCFAPSCIKLSKVIWLKKLQMNKILISWKCNYYREVPLLRPLKTRNVCKTCMHVTVTLTFDLETPRSLFKWTYHLSNLDLSVTIFEDIKMRILSWQAVKSLVSQHRCACWPNTKANLFLVPARFRLIH